MRKLMYSIFLCVFKALKKWLKRNAQYEQPQEAENWRIGTEYRHPFGVGFRLY